ncbi:MAG TPA: hypothetical protein VFW33_23105 [Gemmataceae bacterium]|nr:hypothetical protein [Gemmataceae bacterium]
MSGTGETRVTVRVEVVVEGGGREPRVTTWAGPFHAPSPGRPRAQEIINPSGGDPVPVFACAGGLCIDANGTAPTSSQGYFPIRVCAIVFPTPSPTIPSSPPGGAVCITPNATDGTWAFSQAQGNPVPGATCAPPSGSGCNNTLVVWYDFGGGIPLSIESRPFVGVCVSPSGSGPPLSGAHGPPPPPPALLHATFSGSLAGLGTVALASTGAGWIGLTVNGGGALLAFGAAGSGFSLLCVGTLVQFLVSNAPDSSGPFSWSASGTLQGPSPGAFTVVVTE